MRLDETARLKQQLKESKQRTKEMEERMKKKIESTREELMTDLIFHQEKGKKTLDAHTEEKKKIMEGMNKAVLLEQERLKLMHRTELESKQREWSSEMEAHKKVYEQSNAVLDK